jgi:predicted nucleic acid-binding Zn ribbon protein
MSFNSLDRILALLEQQPGWEQYQQYCQVVDCWQQVVDQKLLQHTRPLYVSRQILWVAISSYSLAQELSLQRFSLLQKLNHQLSFVLKDIRFSPQHWYQSKNLASNSTSSSHPSQIEISQTENKILNSPPAKDLNTAVQRWQKILQERSQHLPTCPQCGCATPLGELERWQLCCHCISQKWAAESHFSTANLAINNQQQKNQD